MDSFKTLIVIVVCIVFASCGANKCAIEYMDICSLRVDQAMFVAQHEFSRLCKWDINKTTCHCNKIDERCSQIKCCKEKVWHCICEEKGEIGW